LQHAQDGIDAAQVFVERCTPNLLLAESEHVDIDAAAARSALGRGLTL
jgi:hypothetical protein